MARVFDGNAAAVLGPLCMAAAASLGAAQMVAPAEHPAIAYSTSAPTDAIARLQQKIDARTATLDFDAERGYLPSLLAHLDIPVSSQGLVFSKTSLQLDRIAPWSPRALYFNDDVYVGWVQQGPIVEIASVDAKLGTVFYTLPQQKTEHPAFQRETTTCLICHDSSSVTGGVPGVIMRSMYTDRYGYGIFAIGTSVTSDMTPLKDRWGGWYVTGTHGPQRHAGNVMAPLVSHEIGNVRVHMNKVDLGHGANVTDLSGRFDAAPYLSAQSDLVALMVMAHQVTVHNLITRAGYAAWTGRETRNPSEDLLRAMLFVKEAPLTGPVKGTTSFAADFAARGPRDGRGRSLRDLDLETRLLRYPLSFLIYSDQFNGLPAAVKDQVYRRLHDVLSGQDTSAVFAHLSSGDRAAILEILRDTKPDFGMFLGRM